MQGNIAKLRHVRVSGIRSLLIKTVPEEALKHRLAALTSRTSEEARSALDNLTAHDLIRLAAASPEVTEKHIDALWEEYRYGDRPSIYLHLTKPMSANYNSPVDVIAQMHENLPIPDQEEESPLVRNVQFLDQEQFEGSVLEFRYRYEHRIDYIDPENEQAKHVYELRYSFCWVDLADEFIVMHGAPETVRKAVMASIESTFHLTAVKPLLHKTLIDMLFDRDRRRRVSLHHPNPSANRFRKVTISDAESGVGALPPEYSDYDIPSSLYTEFIEEGDRPLTSSMGINIRETKIYLTRSIRATQFRRWGLALIRRVLPYVKAVEQVAVAESIAALTQQAAQLLRPYPTNVRPLVASLAQALAQSVAAGGNPVRHGLDLQRLIQQMGSQLLNRVEYTCSQCGQETTVTCPSCHYPLDVKFEDVRLVFRCERCGEDLDPASTSVLCEEGHYHTMDDVAGHLLAFPSTSLNEAVAEILNRHFAGVSYNAADSSFQLTTDRLILLPGRQLVILQPDHIEEFSDLPSLDSQVRLQTVQKLQEKCEFSTHENCQVCATQRTIPCLLKLFAGEGGFLPHPHHGAEFGDVDCNVAVKGRQLLMQGIAKSGKAKNITLSSKTGREILEQGLNGLSDNRVQLVAIVAPTNFDGQLKSQLRLLALKFAKQLVFWDGQALARLLLKRQQQGYEIVTDPQELKRRLGA